MGLGEHDPPLLLSKCKLLQDLGSQLRKAIIFILGKLSQFLHILFAICKKVYLEESHAK